MYGVFCAVKTMETASRMVAVKHEGEMSDYLMVQSFQLYKMKTIHAAG